MGSPSPVAPALGLETSVSALTTYDPPNRQKPTVDAERLVPAKYVYDRLSLSRASFYSLLAAGLLYPVVPLKVGPRATRYRVSDVIAFEEAAAQRGAVKR
jgi:predicted DNA-binding transcriptional regulator AlpA